jgi:SRSO17 transposase
MQSWDQLPLEQSPAGAPRRPWVWQSGEGPAENETDEAAESDVWDLHAPHRWGLSAEAISTVGEGLYECGRRFRDCFKTRTRDTSAKAYNYLRGQLTMDNERHFAHRARNLTGDDGQALQHFMANAPWVGQAVCGQMPAEIKATAALAQGSTLILEESAEEKAGTPNAGAARQDNGRLGQVDSCRVDTCLTYANGGLWAMVEGALCLPDAWFGEACAQTRHELGLPPERTCETKIALGLKMVKRGKAQSVPFDLLACDALYGRDSQFRADWAAETVP